MLALIATLAAAFSVLMVFIHAVNNLNRSWTVDNSSNTLALDRLRRWDKGHRLLSAFLKVVDEDGASCWPPEANHDEWPMALRPYREVYLAMAPYLSTTEVSLHDEDNQKSRNQFRLKMQRLLATIKLKEAESVLQLVESGHCANFSRSQYNGFYACIACLRHAYRWAINPIVKVAQLEQVVVLPNELELPWEYLKRHFDITSDGGNIMSNVINNFRAGQELVYKINVGMDKSITHAEEVFCQTFFDAETQALPIYIAMVKAIITFERGDKAAACSYLDEVSNHLKNLLRHFYKRMHGSQISHSAWMRYVQGIHGWGAGRMIQGTFMVFDGLSGSQLPIIQAIDAFLGLEQYLSKDHMRRYISINQRRFFSALRLHCLRPKLRSTMDDEAVKARFSTLIKEMRVFRAVHKSRAIPYLKAAAPERFPMTAGASMVDVASKSHEDEIWRPLYEVMDARFKQTV